jgi:hypothetical protein
LPQHRYEKANIQTFLVGELQEAEYNARKITGDAYTALKKSLTEFGLITHPVVNMVDGSPRIVGGHQRVKALMDAGVEKVDCVVVDLDETQEKTANFTLNNKAIQGKFIPEMTQSVLDTIQELCEGSFQSYADNLRLTEVLPQKLTKQMDADAQTNHIIAGQTSDHYEESPMPDPPISEIGKTYSLGNHQIYCGEREPTEDLRLFGSLGAQMTMTSFEDIGGREHVATLSHILQNTLGAVYIVVPWDAAVAYTKAFEEAGGVCETHIVTYAPMLGDNMDGSSYLIIYGSEMDTNRTLYTTGNRTNLWSLHRTPPTDDLPVELIVKALLNGSQEGDVVLDPHLCKGAVLIAGEKTGRSVVGYVGKPSMCDLIRKRWAEFVFGHDCDWQQHAGEKIIK